MTKLSLVIFSLSVGCCTSFAQNKDAQGAHVVVLIDTSCGNPILESQFFQRLQVTVTKVLSGNEIEVTLRDGQPVIVRLQAIEAPPPDKPFGSESKQYLIKKALHQEIDLTVRQHWMPDSMPSVSHVSAIVHLRKGFEDLNYSMLCLGLAKYIDTEPYGMSSYDQCTYIKASKMARSQALGVWSVAP